MMSAGLRRFAIYLFLGGALYHSIWMWVSRASLAQPLAAPLHFALLYAVPALLAVAGARLMGEIGGERTSLVRWLLVIALGVVVPLVALQLVGAAACLMSRECL